MLTVNVKVLVKKNMINQFIEATIINAKKSNKEDGIARFDLVQGSEDPSSFMLIEVYKTLDAPEKHKETEHYKIWKETVEPMMEKPRESTKYNTIYTKDTNYEL